MAYWQNAKTVPATPCLSELYRLYATTAMDSYVDLCLYPFPNVVVGNESNTYLGLVTIGTGPGATTKLMNITQPINQYWCTNCPVGPFLDYSHLVRCDACHRIAALTKARRIQKFDAASFDPPCVSNFKTITTGWMDFNVTNLKTYPASSPGFPYPSCYVSLNFVDDPLFGFQKQFPGLGNSNNTCASPFQCVALGSSGTGRRLLQRSGGTASSGGGGGSPSDVRLKTNIFPTGRHIGGLPEYTWLWNDVAKSLRLDGHRTVGVLAQEAQALLPQAVSTGSDGYLRVDYSLLARLFS